MIAIDANVVVRDLTGDHPDQSPRARALIDAGQVFVPVTVILETERVLRSAYRLSPAAVIAALRAFCGLPGVTVEDATPVAAALDRAAGGLDFAVALHMARAARCDAFATFDQRLLRAPGLAGLREP